MKIEPQRKLFFIISCILGILIMLAPTIITGYPYNETLMGGYAIGDFVMRTVSLIVGLLVIYDAIKRSFK